MSNDAAMVAGVLHAMGLLVAERLPDGSFRWVYPPPPWAESFGCTADGPCDLAAAFAFMGLFLQDAEVFWERAEGAATITSAPWSEPDAHGVEHQLEAVAMRLLPAGAGEDDAAEVLAVAGAGADIAQTQSILQAARERRLAVDRELAVHRQVEQQLRLRVEQRTVELARTNEQLRALASQVALAEQRERHRLAVGLHDHVGQLLAAAKLGVSAAKPAAADAEQQQRLARVLDALNQAIDATRTLTFELSPPMLYELGLVATLASLVEQTAARHPQVAFSFRDDDAVKPLAQDLEVVLFQVARELIGNALKHANATRMDITTGVDGGRLVLSVSDDGVGFDPRVLDEPVVGPGGFGLYSVRERLQGLGAGLEVETGPGAGTVARVVAPLI